MKGSWDGLVACETARMGVSRGCQTGREDEKFVKVLKLAGRKIDWVHFRQSLAKPAALFRKGFKHCRI